MSHILGNPKVHYHVHNSQPLFPIPRHMNPVHTPPYYILQIRFNIILSYMPKFSQPSLSFRFRHQDPVRNSILPTRPTHTAWERGLHLDNESVLDIRYDNIIIINYQKPQNKLQLKCLFFTPAHGSQFWTMPGQRLRLVGLFFVLIKGEASNQYPKGTQNVRRGGNPGFFLM